jgi:signal transduction histidine kinase/integral membrane sensor domain MASE1
MNKTANKLLLLSAVAIIYFVAARLGLMLAYPGTNASPIWLATGIALAAMLLLGRRMWPGIAMGAFVANFIEFAGLGLSIPASFAASLSTSAGNTLEALLGAYLINRFAGTRNPFERSADVLTFIAFGAVISTTVSAAIGTATFCLGISDWSNFASISLTWWLGDAAGAIIVVPLVMTFKKADFVGRISQPSKGNMLLWGLIAVICYIIFSGNLPLNFLLYPILIMAAFRLGQFGSALAVGLISIVSTYVTVNGAGPFSAMNMNDALLLQQGFIGSIATASMVLAAVVAEQKKTVLKVSESEERLRRTNRTLYAIGRCNELVAHAVNEQGLMDDICGSIIAADGYSMAWIGIADHDENSTVRPVAQAGFEAGYLDSLYITWADTDLGRGPTGTAIRTGKPSVCQHIETDPRLAPWRDEAIKRGYAASIALPLCLNDVCFGVLTIYASAPDAFDEDETSMLYDMAKTLAFGIGSLRTKTERNQAVQELRKNQEHLEEQVHQRTFDLQKSQLALMNMLEDLNYKKEELEAANEKLQEVDRLKSMFIASMSHELRTPLNSIIGFSSILLQEWRGVLSNDQKDDLRIVNRAGKHLLSLINDVIDVSKIEAGRIDISVETFDIADVIKEVVDFHKKEVEQKGLELKLDGVHQTIETDRRRVLQCVMNLVSNAVKFTEKGIVRIQNSEQIIGIDKYAKIIVTDTGIGIKEEDLPKLFSSFLRLDSPLRSLVPGTGLGLYLTKKLITDILKGEISVESSPGIGSVFTMRLPVKNNGDNGLNGKIS